MDGKDAMGAVFGGHFRFLRELVQYSEGPTIVFLIQTPSELFEPIESIQFHPIYGNLSMPMKIP